MSKDNTLRYNLLVSYYFGEARFDKTRAAELAGYKGKTRESLNSLAQQLFRKPEVQRIMNEHVEKITVTQEDLFQEYARLAMWDCTADYEAAKRNTISAKAYDTQARLKITAMTHLMKVVKEGRDEKLDQIRAALEQYRNDNPEMSPEEIAEEFSQYVDPDMMREVMAELLKSDAAKEVIEETVEEKINE